MDFPANAYDDWKTDAPDPDGEPQETENPDDEFSWDQIEDKSLDDYYDLITAANYWKS